MDQEVATKKHILFVQPELEGVGGVQTVIPVVAKRLSVAGYQVSAFAAYGNVPDSEVDWSYKRSLGEELSPNVFHKIIKLIKRGRELVKNIDNAKPDILIVSTTGVSVLSLLLRKLGMIKLPILVYVHESIFLSGKGQRYLLKKLYPKADGVICVSLGIKDELKDNIGIPEDRLILSYNSLFKTDETEGERANELNQCPLFVTASRLEEVKGVDMLVDLFIRFLKENKGKLLIMGTGSLAQSLAKKVKEVGLTERIIFAGYVKNVRKEFMQATAYVSCARYESFGMSLVEALAVGIPVVASDVPYGPREIMGEFGHKEISYPYRTRYGYLIGSPEDYDQEKLYLQFAEALRLVQKNKFDSRELKARADFFNAEDQVRSIEKMVEKCLT